MLKEVYEQPLENLSCSPITSDFQSEIIPSYDSKEFLLTDFHKKKEIVYSDNLIVYGLSWRLKVYPMGNDVARGSFIAVFVEMIDGFAESLKFDVRVELVNQLTEGIVVSREFTSNFEPGESWGYNRFFKIDLL